MDVNGRRKGVLGASMGVLGALAGVACAVQVSESRWQRDTLKEVVMGQLNITAWLSVERSPAADSAGVRGRPGASGASGAPRNDRG